MSAIAIDEKVIGPQATSLPTSGSEHIQDSEDIDFVVENVRARVSTPLVSTRLLNVELSAVWHSHVERLVGSDHNHNPIVDVPIFPRQYHRS